MMTYIRTKKLVLHLTNPFRLTVFCDFTPSRPLEGSAESNASDGGNTVTAEELVIMRRSSGYVTSYVCVEEACADVYGTSVYIFNTDCKEALHC